MKNFKIKNKDNGNNFLALVTPVDSLCCILLLSSQKAALRAATLRSFSAIAAHSIKKSIKIAKICIRDTWRYLEVT